MDFVLLKEFLTGYSLPTVVIAVIVCAISIAVSKIFKDKIDETVLNHATFFLAIILYFAYDMVFISRALCFSIDAFYAGILCGSLATVIASAINRIGRGQPISVSAVRLLIEGLIDGIVQDSAVTATAAALEDLLISDNGDCIDTVKEILTVNSNGVTEEKISSVAKLIIDSVKTLKTE